MTHVRQIGKPFNASVMSALSSIAHFAKKVFVTACNVTAGTMCPPRTALALNPIVVGSRFREQRRTVQTFCFISRSDCCRTSRFLCRPTCSFDLISFAFNRQCLLLLPFLVFFFQLSTLALMLPFCFQLLLLFLVIRSLQFCGISFRRRQYEVLLLSRLRLFPRDWFRIR